MDLNPRDRVMAAIWNEEPDTVPIGELDIQDEVIARFTGTRSGVNSIEMLSGVLQRGLSADQRARSIQQKIDSTWKFIDALGLDLITVTEAPALDYQPKMLDERTWIDEWGQIWSYRESPYGRDAWYVGGALKSPEDVKMLEPPDPYAPGRMDAVEYAVKKYAGKRAIFGSLPGPKMPYLARGIDGYTLDLYRRPVLAKQFMDMATRYNVGIAKLMIDLGVDALAMGGDLAYRDGPLMTVEHFREVYAPHIKCVVEVAHKRGIPLIKHSDGNLNPILRDLIETGIDGIHSIEPIAGMDLGRVKAEYGDRICLMGNVDCTYTLTTKPVESVQAEVKECMDAAAAGGGYILSSSNCFHKACRIDNIIAMINAGRRYGIYPRSGGRG